MEVIKALKQEILNSKNNIELIDNQDPSDDLIKVLQITEKSLLGSIIKYTKGILIKDKFLRLLGSEESEWTDTIKKWNNFPQQTKQEHLPSDCVIFGYDLVGGFFAINGGAFGKDLGKVFYFAPDTVKWENLNMAHSDFISWCISGNVDQFYESFIWNNAQDLISNTKIGQGISIYPFLWSKEGKDINAASKKIVPLKELWDINIKIMKKLGG